MDYRGFSIWEGIININYGFLFERPSPDQTHRVAVDKIPPELNWVASVELLAGGTGDITKHNLVYETNYEQCLHLLAYLHHRDKFNNKLHEKINK